MALDKVVDSTQLDADITTVADAIRAKGGTSAALSFPEGMAQAVADISGGGGGISRYMTLTAEQANSTVALTEVGTWTNHWVIKYSTDNTTWQDYTFGTTITLADIGDYVSFAGVGNWTGRAPKTSSEYHTFVMTGKISASGNCCGLISQDADGMLLYGFYYLFYNCTSLTTAPDLPATTLASFCYQSMFNGCTSLTTAPDLPATTLASYCYQSMFSGCTNLTTVPDLPATTLASFCCGSMFNGCTSLTTAPDLPATTLASSCYQSMFRGCTVLNSIKIYYAGSFNSNYFSTWVNGVSPTGDFYYNGTDTTRGAGAIPTDWTVHTF